MRRAIQIVAVLWLIGGATVLATSLFGMYLWHSTGLAVEQGYPPNALVILRAIPFLVPLLIIQSTLAVASVAAAIALLRWQSWGRATLVALSAIALGYTLLSSLIFQGSTLLTDASAALFLAAGLSPFAATAMLLSRARARALFRP